MVYAVQGAGAIAEEVIGRFGSKAEFDAIPFDGFVSPFFERLERLQLDDSKS
jgi:hypothetical protein